MKKQILLLSYLLFAIVHFSYAQNNAIVEQSNQLLVAAKPKEAFALVKKEAVNGNSAVQYQLGLYYQQGVGTVKNDSIANVWFLKSANQGNIEAQKVLAYRYMEGIGTTTNKSKSLEMFRKCSVSSTECGLNLINSYNLGIGTPKNPIKAVEIAKEYVTKNFKIADIYISEIIFFLVEKYAKGDGIVQANTAEAMKWILLYNEHKKGVADQNTSKLKSYFKTSYDKMNKASFDATILQVKQISQKTEINFNNLK